MVPADVWTHIIPESDPAVSPRSAQWHMRVLRARILALTEDVNALDLRTAANAEALARIEAAVAAIPSATPIDLDALAEAVADKLATRLAE